MSSLYQNLVSFFHKGIGVIPGGDVQKSIPLRISLIEEEVKETIEAIQARKTVLVIDGLCDILYVTYGTADVYSIDIDEDRTTGPKAGLVDWLRLDHRAASLQKLSGFAVQAIREQGPMHHWLRALVEDCWDCAAEDIGIDLRPFYLEVHRTNMWKLKGPKREDGKQLKPPDWKPPRIEAMYNRLLAGNPPACVHVEKGHAVIGKPHPQGGHFCLDCGGLFVTNLSGADVP